MTAATRIISDPKLIRMVTSTDHRMISECKDSSRDTLNKARLGLSCGLTERLRVENRRPGPGAGAQSLGFRH